jgi:hypothetical protein
LGISLEALRGFLFYSKIHLDSHMLSLHRFISLKEKGSVVRGEKGEVKRGANL